MSDKTADETERTEASAERIAQLEQQVERLQEQVDTLTPNVSRRQAIQGGAALGLGALLGGGGATLGATQSARAAPDADDVGAPNDHVDLYAQNLYDVDGNQYDQFSELGFREDSNSPYNVGSDDETLTFGDTVNSVGSVRLILVRVGTTSEVTFTFDTGTFDYQGFDTQYTPGQSEGLAIPSAAASGSFICPIWVTFDSGPRDGLYRTPVMFGRFGNSTQPLSSITLSTSAGNSIKAARVLYRPTF